LHIVPMAPQTFTLGVLSTMPPNNAGSLIASITVASNVHVVISVG
jgi:hypothetical protein